ncbi:MAG: hypothetical protein ACT4P1_03310 [Sporichthyaceae bacterium]
MGRYRDYDVYVTIGARRSTAPVPAADYAGELAAAVAALGGEISAEDTRCVLRLRVPATGDFVAIQSAFALLDAFGADLTALPRWPVLDVSTTLAPPWVSRRLPARPPGADDDPAPVLTTAARRAGERAAALGNASHCDRV